MIDRKVVLSESADPRELLVSIPIYKLASIYSTGFQQWGKLRNGKIFRLNLKSEAVW